MGTANYHADSFKVLIVDDSKSITQVLKDLLSTYFNVLIADSVDTAIPYIDKFEIAIAVIDYEMPGKDGIQLAKYIKQHQPFARRFLITGHKELDVIKRAINEGGIHKFIEKPIVFAEFEELLLSEIKIYINVIEKEEQLSSYLTLAKKYQTELEERNNVMYELLQNMENQNAQVLSSKLSQMFEDMVTIITEKVQEMQKAGVQPGDLYQLSQISKDLHIFSYEFEIPQLKIILELYNSYLYALSGQTTQLLQALDIVTSQLTKITLESQLNKFNSHLSRLKQPDFSVHAKQNPQIIFDGIIDVMTADYNEIFNVKFDINWMKQEDIAIGYIIIVKGQFPIYTRVVSPVILVNPDLISNFFVALSLFTKEVFYEGGTINTIIHDRGVFLTQRPTEDISFICISNAESLKLRIAFKEYTNNSYEYIEKLEEGYALNEDDAFMNEQFLKYLHEFQSDNLDFMF